MKLFLLGLVPSLLVLQCVFAEEKVLVSDSHPKRFQFGSLIKNDEQNGILLEHVGDVMKFKKADDSESTMLEKNIMLAINPLNFRRTMVTMPLSSDITESDELRKYARDYYCTNVKFMRMEDISSKEKIPDNTLLILTNDIDASLLTLEHLKVLKEKNCKLGFLLKNKVIDDHIRKILADSQVGFIENLEIPNDLDLDKVLNSEQHFFGFKLMFVPFKNATLISHAEQKSLVNLADFVLFQADDRLVKYCKENKDKVISFSHQLVSDRFPMLPGLEMPQIIERQVGSENNLWLRFAGQTGTSLIAPYRYDKSKSNVAMLNERLFFRPCVLFSIPSGDSSNFKITKSLLEQWKSSKNLNIPENSVCLINTGFWKKWDSNPDDYVKNFPSIELDAVKYLVDDCKCVAIGIDSLALDDHSMITSSKWPVHGYLAEKDIPALVNLRFDKAENFPVVGSRCVLSYLRIDKGTSSPLALFGLPNYDTMEMGGELKKEEPSFVKEETAKLGEKVSHISSIAHKKIEEEKEHAKKVIEEKKEKLKGVAEDKKHKLSGLAEETKTDVKEAVHGKRPELKRWQFSRIIQHQAEDCDCTLREVNMDVYMDESGTGDMHPMLFTETNILVDPSINKVTTISKSKNYAIVSTKGCIETLFIKTTDLSTIKRRLMNEATDGMLVIFDKVDLMKLNDPDVIKQAADKNIMLGFFDDLDLPSGVRNRLIDSNLTIWENLKRPDNFDINEIDEHRVYYSFALHFAPTNEETSLSDSLHRMRPPRKINLADLVVFDPTTASDIEERCSKKKVISLSHPWGPIHKVPVLQNVSRPKLSEDGKKLSYFDHYGTHFDLPSHLDPLNQKMDRSKLPETLDRPVCFKIDVPFNDEDSFSISKEHLMEWEKRSGRIIPEGCLVILNTGFGKKYWGNPNRYEKNFPGLSLSGAKFLAEDRKVAAIGIDSLTIDNGEDVSLMRFPTHHYLADQNILIIENIGNQLDQMSNDLTGICVMSYLRNEKATGSPVALYGLLSEVHHETHHEERKGHEETEEETAAAIQVGSSFAGLALATLLALGLHY